MKSQEDHHRDSSPSTSEDPSLLLCYSVFLMTESPHLELNEADLIAVITMTLQLIVRKAF